MRPLPRTPLPSRFSLPYLGVLTAALFLLPLVFAHRSSVLATSYQLCKLGSACEIGEYLYQDDYSVFTGASCTLSAKAPGGSPFLTNQALTESADGWYSHSFATTGQAEGLYRATLCCTAGSDYLCLDKTFEIKQESSAPTAGEIADAVLNEPVSEHTGTGSLGETLASIGSIPANVWSYSTRSLSTFGTLVSDFWKHNPEDAGNTTNSAYNALLGQIQQNRLALEKLINEPIIENFLEAGDPPDVKEKIAATRDHVNSLYSLTQSNKSRLLALEAGWNTLSQAQLTQELKLIVGSFGGDPQAPPPDTVVGHTTWLEDAWGNSTTTEANNLALAALTSLQATLNQATYLGANRSAPTLLKESLAIVTQLESVIGTVTSSPTQDTLFGHIRRIQQRAQQLEDQTIALRSLESNFSQMSQTEFAQSLEVQEQSLLAINQFNSPLKILQNKTTNPTHALKNQLYSLQALLNLNKSLLAYPSSSLVGHTWLAEGSIVFRSVITNPSKLISQDVKLEYFLPKELQEKDIIELDPNLRVTYDVERDQLKVLGGFTLSPEESKVIFLEAEDVWQLNPDDLTNYRQLAAELVASLKKTSHYGQAVSIQGDIDTTLNQIETSQDDTLPPAQRIRQFRKTQLNLLEVEEKLASLKQLVTTADNANSLTGFIGGSAAIMAWGLIVVILGGFSFLSLYIKKQALASTDSSSPSPSSTPLIKTISLEDKPRHLPRWLPFGLAGIILAALALSYFLLRRPALQAPVEIPAASSTPSPTPAPTSDTQAEQVSEKVVLGQTTTLSQTLEIDSDSSVNLRTGPGTSYDIALALRTTTTLYIFGAEQSESGDSWTRVGLTSDPNTVYYLRSDLLD